MGSLVAITDESGILLERRNYDPWGKPRNPQTLAYTLSNLFAGTLDVFNTEKFANTFSECIYGPFSGPYKNTYPSYNIPKK